MMPNIKDNTEPNRGTLPGRWQGSEQQRNNLSKILSPDTGIYKWEEENEERSGTLEPSNNHK